MFIQTSNIIGSNVYRTPDKPTYYTGNKVLIAICAWNVVLFIGTKIFYVTANKYVSSCTSLSKNNTDLAPDAAMPNGTS